LILKELTKAKCPLDGIAAVGTLYGKGFGALLRNLAWNPQIDTIIVVGQDRSGTGRDLGYFFLVGTEPVVRFGINMQMIRVSGRLLDYHLDRESMPTSCKVTTLTDCYRAEHFVEHRTVFEKQCGRPPLDGVKRCAIPLPPATDRPKWAADMDSVSINTDTAVDAYRQLIHRLYTGGTKVKLKKGPRVELRNVKVVIRQPESLLSDAREEFDVYLDTPTSTWVDYYDKNFDPTPAKDSGVSYTYGDRLGNWFFNGSSANALGMCRNMLDNDIQSRKAFISLYDTRHDLPTDGSAPCLATVFFRAGPASDVLNMTATFRSHNAAQAWPMNAYALARILERLSDSLNLGMGSLTIFSQSISLDLSDEVTEARCRDIATNYSNGTHYSDDPNGSFVISIEDMKIKIEHMVDNVVMHTWFGTKAIVLQHRLYASGIISDIGHGIYLGRMLARAEECLRIGSEFIQE
jgi:thymidylate synthase